MNANTQDKPVTPLIDLADLPPNIAARTTIDPCGCWRCSLSIDRDGYSRVGGRGTHRVVYELLVGEIPADKPVLDHVYAWGCRFRDCIAPFHLQPCTVRENTLRGRSFAAANALKDRCGACGAEYDLYNTYFGPDGRRDCRACVRRRASEYQARVRAGQPVRHAKKSATRSDLGIAA